MTYLSRSGRAGALAALAIGTFTLFGMSGAGAESIANVNGIDIDSSLADFYLENRWRTPAAQVTAEQREAGIQELIDIYLLTTLPIADELAKDGRIVAQIEMQARGVLAQAVVQDFFAKNPSTEEEILAEYEIQKALAPKLQFKARHILVESQAAATDLIAQLKEGADFVELAKEHSTGPTGPDGGDLGWFSPETMVKPFSDALTTMQDGEFSPEPVQTQFGWHVILREASRPAEPPPLDSVRESIEQAVAQKKFQAYLEDLRAEYAASE